MFYAAWKRNKSQILLQIIKRLTLNALVDKDRECQLTIVLCSVKRTKKTKKQNYQDPTTCVLHIQYNQYNQEPRKQTRKIDNFGARYGTQDAAGHVAHVSCFDYQVSAILAASNPYKHAQGGFQTRLETTKLALARRHPKRTRAQR